MLKAFRDDVRKSLGKSGRTATAEIDANGDGSEVSDEMNSILETNGKVTHVTKWQRIGLHCLLVLRKEHKR